MNLVIQSAAPLDLAALAPLHALLPTPPTRVDAHACRVRIDTPVSAALRDALAAHCTPLRLDYALVPADLRLSDFALLAMDMDSTLITIECIDEIADFHGVKAQVAAITEAAMRGEIRDFSESLRRRVALLAGLDASVLEQVYAQRLRLSPGAEAMLAAVREAGLKTLLVSGGFTFFTERLRERLGLDFAFANCLETVDGKFTGRVQGDILDADAKARHLREACTRLGVSGTQAIAMGDGSNDLRMMAEAGLSVAFRAKPVVQAAASVAFNFVGLDGLPRLFA